MSAVEVFHRQHVARLERIARAAENPKVKAKPLRHEIPNAPYGEPKINPNPGSPIPDDWVDRQKRLHKKPWFEIVDGPLDFPRVKHTPRIDEIQRAICEHFGVSYADLISSRRTQRVVMPRQVGIYICRLLTPRSFPEIGKRFGGRDHTTVLHAVRKIERLRAEDMHIGATVEMICEQVGGIQA